MLAVIAQPFVPPAIPWLQPRSMPERVDLGPGLDPVVVTAALKRLLGLSGVQALVVFGSRGRGVAHAGSDLDLALVLVQSSLSSEHKAAWWSRARAAIGPVGVGVDLVLAGVEDAARLSQSRWHVWGDVAREGRVLYAAG